jgi:phosphoribosyl 1,2-cyclic phosphodiesterase
VDFRDFKSGETLAPNPDIRVRTVALNHPGHATGYRVDYHGRSVCYLTDTEHYPDRLDHRLLMLIDHADMVIYDATYTDDEYPAHQGWGHSTWREGVKLCQAGSVSNFVAFHHAPEHDDEFLDRIAAELYKVTELRSIMAREGMTLHLPQSVKGKADS